ncbi:chlorophyll a/b-binding protein [Phormidesmis priestleyi]
MQTTQETTQQKIEQPYTEAAINIEQGFTPNSEIWNGRFAMIGFVSILLIEVLSGQGIVHFWSNLLSNIW